MLLEALFWAALLLGAAGAPVGWPFLRPASGFEGVRRRHGLDPAAGQRVRRAVFTGGAADGNRERAAAAEWAAALLDQRAAARGEHPGRWRAFLALEAAQVVVALAGLAVALARRGGRAPVLEVLFVLLALGPVLRPVTRRRRDERVRRAAEANGATPTDRAS